MDKLLRKILAECGEINLELAEQGIYDDHAEYVNTGLSIYIDHSGAKHLWEVLEDGYSAGDLMAFITAIACKINAI